MQILFGFSANQKDNVTSRYLPVRRSALYLLWRYLAVPHSSVSHSTTVKLALRKDSGEQLGRKPIISEAHNLFSFI